MPGPQISRLPSSGHVILHAQIWAAPGKESIIKEEALKIKKYTEENEKGSCLTYRVTEDIKDPGHFIIFEEYAGQEAVDKHFESPVFTAFEKKVKEEGLVDASRGGLKIEFYEEYK